MTRNISWALQEQIAKAELTDVVLPFVSITHEDLEQPLRFVSDGIDYIRGGATWTGIPFDVKILQDDESVPRGELRVQNVDRVIGESIMQITGPVRVTIELLTSADFDLEVTPRQEIGTAAVEYRAAHLYLTGVTIDALSVSGELVSWDYSQELYPAMSATRDRLPGLFV